MTMQPKRLYRSRNNRMFAGVCSGLGEYFDMDPTVIRLLFVLGVFLGFGGAIFVYLVMMFVVPEEPLSTLETAGPSPDEQTTNADEPPVS